MMTSSSLRTSLGVFAVYRQNLGKGLGTGCIEFFYKAHLSVPRRTAIHQPSPPPEITPIESTNGHSHATVICRNRVRTATYIFLAAREGQQRSAPEKQSDAAPAHRAAHPTVFARPIATPTATPPPAPTGSSPFASIPAGSHPAQSWPHFPPPKQKQPNGPIHGQASPRQNATPRSHDHMPPRTTPQTQSPQHTSLAPLVLPPRVRAQPAKKHRRNKEP